MLNIFSHFSVWDIVLIAVVAVEGTLAAYIYNPKWKSFFLLLPFPFTFAVLALSQPVNATNVAGLIVSLCFTFAVRACHCQLRLPIVWSIVISAGGYCIVGSTLAKFLPQTGLTFFLACAVVFVVAIVLYCAMPHISEPSQRSTLAVWKKFISIVVVMLFITIIKTQLQGFMTVFPMLGVIICYEARLSLYTVCRYIPVSMLCFVPMMTVCYVLQGIIGIVPSLAIGWIAYLIVLAFFLIAMRNKAASDVANVASVSM